MPVIMVVIGIVVEAASQIAQKDVRDSHNMYRTTIVDALPVAMCVKGVKVVVTLHAVAVVMAVRTKHIKQENTMAKKLTFICVLLLLAIVAKSQIYCYHCYKEVSTNGGRQQLLPIIISYRYFTFQGDLLFEYALSGKASKKDKMAWKFTGMRDRGHLCYFRYYRNIWGKYDDMVEYIDKDRCDICYVSDDRNLICIVEDGIYSYYERCPDRNCR